MSISNHRSLSIEQLENRMMLSTVQVFAAGDTGQEQFDVLVNDQVAATFNLNNVAGELQLFEFETAEPVVASDIRVEFTNDAFDPETGFDRNLTVDRIVIDFENTFFTSSPTVFTSGTFNNGNFTAGFGIGDTLYTNGFYQYGQDSAPRNVLSVRAEGAEGDEQFEVFVDDQRVAAFSTVGQDGATTYSVTLNQPISPGQVKVQFVNDLYLPEEGIDRNLIVDWIDINNVVFPTESPEVFSTGTYIEGPGVVPGFFGSNTLHTNGFFQFADFDFEAPTVTLFAVDDVTRFGAGSNNITIEIADNNPLQFPTGSPITIVGPSGQEFVPVQIFGSRTDEGSLLVGYQLRTFNGPFTEADNGTYEIFLNDDAISDSDGNFAAGGLLGTFEVDIANSPGNDLTPPTAQLLNTGAVFTSGPVELSASFEDEVFIGTIDNDALSITGADGSTLFAFTSSGGGFGDQLRTRGYTVFANEQFQPLTAEDNGVYTVRLNEDSVFDQVGNAAPSQFLGTFEVRLDTVLT